MESGIYLFVGVGGEGEGQIKILWMSKFYIYYAPTMYSSINE